MKEARRAVATCFGIVGAAAAVFIGVIANRTSSPWKNGWFILWVVILGVCIGLAVVATLPDIGEWLGHPLKRLRGPDRQPRPYLERWLYTSEGLKSPAQMSVLETTLPGTGYRKMPGERLPWARCVILIASSRVGPDLDSRQLWSQFEAFLQQPAASSVASMMTGTRADLRWSRRGTRRAGQIDAVLTPGEDDDAVAAVRLDLPDDTSSYGRDNRCAALIVHFELTGRVFGTMDPLVLKCSEERFGHRIVVAYPGPAHRMPETVFLQRPGELPGHIGCCRDRSGKPHPQREDNFGQSSR